MVDMEVGLRLLRIGHLSVDIRSVLGSAAPVLMFSGPEAFSADIAVLAFYTDDGPITIGWIDHASATRFFQQSSTPPGQPVVIPAEWLRPMRELKLMLMLDDSNSTRRWPQ